MRTAEEWHDEVCIAADATHGAIVEVVRRIQAEALEEAARVCDEAADAYYVSGRACASVPERGEFISAGYAARKLRVAIRTLAVRVKGSVS